MIDRRDFLRWAGITGLTVGFSDLISPLKSIETTLESRLTLSRRVPRISVIGISNDEFDSRSILDSIGLRNFESAEINGKAIERAGGMYGSVSPDAPQMQYEPVDIKIAGCSPYKDLYQILHKSDVIFLTAALGSQTNAGIVPLIAAFAHAQNKPVVAVVTLPFHFMGENRVANARLGLARLKDNVDAVFTISLDDVPEFVGNATPLSACFVLANSFVVHTIHFVADDITLWFKFDGDIEKFRRKLKVRIIPVRFDKENKKLLKSRSQDTVASADKSLCLVINNDKFEIKCLTEFLYQTSMNLLEL